MSKFQSTVRVISEIIDIGMVDIQVAVVNGWKTLVNTKDGYK